MNRDRIIKSIAYCGLICELCHQANECDGCKSEKNNCGKHLSEAGCFQRMCCIKKNINGCWECDNFPCDKDMYSNNHDPKVKAFARCIKEDGVENFIDDGIDYKGKTKPRVSFTIDYRDPVNDGVSTQLVYYYNLILFGFEFIIPGVNGGRPITIIPKNLQVSSTQTKQYIYY